jgi:hypothetical protein
MENKKLSNYFAYLSIVSVTVWLGAYITRLLLTYNLFKEGELVLKSFIDNTNAPALLQVLSPLVYLTFVTFCVFIISLTFYLLTAKVKFKENGWLFIIVMIVYLTLPFEIFLMTFDYKLMILYAAKNFDLNVSLPLIIDRLQSLSGFSVILVLCYLTIPYFLIFKPFSKSK